MKKYLVSGLTALVLSGCGIDGQVEFCGPQINSSKEIERHKEKPDIKLNLRSLGGLDKPTLLLDEERAYILTKEKDSYSLLKINPEESTRLIIKYSNPDKEKKIKMDLGDGNLYSLTYNKETQEYQLTH